MLARLAAHRAATEALERALKDDAEQEYVTNGTVPTWRIGSSRITGAVNHTRVEIVNQDEFMEWARDRCPDEVAEVTRLEFRNPAVQEKIREELLLKSTETYPSLAAWSPGDTAPVVIDEGAEVVPGVRFVKGGGYRSTSITIDPAVKRDMARLALEYVRSGDLSVFELSE